MLESDDSAQFYNGAFHYSSPPSHAQIDWFSRANGQVPKLSEGAALDVGSSSYTPSGSSIGTPEGAHRVIEMGGTNSSGIQLEDLVSVLRRVTDGMSPDKSGGAGSDPREGLDYTVGPRQTPPPRADTSVHTGADTDVAMLSLVEGPDAGDRSLNYSSRMLQALSCIEGMSLHPSQESPFPLRKRDDEQESPRDLHEEGKMWRLNKQRWIAMEKSRQELLRREEMERACSFKPKISSYAKNIQRPTSLKPEYRVQNEILHRKQWVAAKKREKVEEELRECTFRPLTLHVIHALSSSPNPSDEVFHKLYDDAEQRYHFTSEVKATIVNEVEKYANGQGGSSQVVGREKIENVVERLFSKVTVSPADLEDPTLHKPQLSEKTQKIIKQKRRCGQRHPNPTEQLYRGPSASLVRSTQQEVGQALEEAQRREALEAERRQREQRRLLLERQRIHAILREKFVFLGKWSAREGRAAYHRGAPQPVSGLTRAAVTLLPPAQSTELLAALERFQRDRISEVEFVAAMVRHMEVEQMKPSECPLAIPLSAETLPRKSRSGSATTKRNSASPQRRSKVKREKANPEVIAAARAKREGFLLKLAEESELKRHGDGPVPFRSRLIPYACRPDVQLPIKKNRSAELRQACARQKLAAKDRRAMYPVVAPGMSEAITRALFPSDAEDNVSPPPHHHDDERLYLHGMDVEPSPIQPVTGPRGVSSEVPSMFPFEEARQLQFSPQRGVESEDITEVPFALRRPSPLKPRNWNTESSGSSSKWRPSAAVPQRSEGPTHMEREGHLLDFGKDVLIQQLREYQRRRSA